MARRKQGGIELVASLPWSVGVVLGLLAFSGARYGIGWHLSSSSSPVLANLGRLLSAGAFAWIAWALLGAFWIAALVSYIGQRKRKGLLETQSDLDSLRAMSWREFEMLVGEAFRRKGYRIEETGLRGADGGIDLILRKNGKTTLVQCKQWRSQRVDVKVVREMYGLLAHRHADAIMIVAFGDYTADAQRFAQGKPIELIHGQALLEMVRAVQTTKQSTEVRKNVDHASAPSTTPDCPKCGTTMVKRANRHSREAFWGCPKYPGCRGTRPA